MYNIATGFLVMLCAVMTGISVANNKLIVAVIYFMACIWFYNKLEVNTIDKK